MTSHFLLQTILRDLIEARKLNQNPEIEAILSSVQQTLRRVIDDKLADST